MPDALLLALAFLCSSAGLGWLAMTLDAHWKQVRGSQAPTGRTVTLLRVLGYAALLGSLSLCLRADHASMAALVWMMALAIAAVFVAMLLAWRPKALLPLVAWLR